MDILFFWQSETSPNEGIPNQVPWLGLVSLFQIWDFCGYSLNTLKYPKMGIGYFSRAEKKNVPQNFSQGDKLSPSDQILVQTLIEL